MLLLLLLLLLLVLLALLVLVLLPLLALLVVLLVLLLLVLLFYSRPPFGVGLLLLLGASSGLVENVVFSAGYGGQLVASCH